VAVQTPILFAEKLWVLRWYPLWKYCTYQLALHTPNIVAASPRLRIYREEINKSSFSHFVTGKE